MFLNVMGLSAKFLEMRRKQHFRIGDDRRDGESNPGHIQEMFPDHILGGDIPTQVPHPRVMVKGMPFTQSPLLP